MRCEEIMKRSLRTISPEDTVQAAASIMRDANVGFLPVCEASSGRITGTLTDRDIAVRVVAENQPASVNVGLVMTREVVTCSPEEDLRTAEERMGEAHKSRIICTDESGRPVGVISLSDLAGVESDERAAQLLQEIAGREASPPARAA